MTTRAVTWVDAETGAVHADGASGDGTVLCGDSLDGENGDANMSPSGKKITCNRCILVIDAAKAIPAWMIERGKP